MSDSTSQDNQSSKHTHQLRDKWAEWLLNKRQAGEENYEQSLRAYFPIRDRVLDNAHIQLGDTVLDVGCGDGLISFGALDLVGPTGKVIFSDISQDCLDYCLQGVDSIGSSGRSEFVRCSADDLGSLGDESVDVVCTRSVLIYVQDKQKCFEEFFRILKPGGRISIFEPINRYSWQRDPRDSYYGIDLTPVHHIMSKLASLSEQESDERTKKYLVSNSMLNFDQNDLMDFAFKAGFTTVNMSCDVESSRSQSEIDWGSFYRSAPNPRANSLYDNLVGRLSPEDLAEFEVIMKEVVSNTIRERHSAVVYLSALK